MNIKSRSINLPLTWPLLALLCALLAACASPPQYVPAATNPEPKPVATSDMMQTLPGQSHFQKRLREVFSTSQPKRIESQK